MEWINKKVTAVNRNIIPRLVSYSKSSSKVVDYSEALKYPLSPIPLSVAHPDRTMKKCKKTDAFKILMSSNTTCSAQTPLVDVSPAFIYGVMFGIAGMTVYPETYVESCGVEILVDCKTTLFN